MKSNFTLTYGLRWEYFGPLTTKQNNLGVLQLGSSPASEFTGMYFRVGGPLYTADKADFGPQLGFAWSPGLFPAPQHGRQAVIAVASASAIPVKKKRSRQWKRKRAERIFCPNPLWLGHFVSAGKQPALFRLLPLQSNTLTTFNVTTSR